MRAYFVRTPRTVRDLRRSHLPEQERDCEIAKTIVLSHIAYENFEEDLTVKRQFIEDNASRCSEGEVWKCLFVHERGHSDGILVMPEEAAFVKWAAYWEARNESRGYRFTRIDHS